MIHYLTDRMRPELKTLAHANYARIYAQLDRLDHSPFHALATALAALRGFIDIDDKPFQPSPCQCPLSGVKRTFASCPLYVRL